MVLGQIVKACAMACNSDKTVMDSLIGNTHVQSCKYRGLFVSSDPFGIGPRVRKGSMFDRVLPSVKSVRSTHTNTSKIVKKKVIPSLSGNISSIPEYSGMPEFEFSSFFPTF